MMTTTTHEDGRRWASTHSGFTLVEILLVIVIIGVLAGMLVVRLSGRTEEARVARAKADISGQLSLALDMFEQDVGRYPTTEEGLASLVTDPGVPGWKGRYLKTDLKPDPWGTPYAYSGDTPEVGLYSVSSAGPDRRPGTEDDILP
jgi:general secretion pathway protein G